MEEVLTTPRLKLTLITHAERGSDELNWLHELRSDKQTTSWRYALLQIGVPHCPPALGNKSQLTRNPSISPPSTTISDTEKIVGSYLPDPTPNSSTGQKTYRLAYAVHELPSPESSTGCPRFIGLVSLVSLGSRNLPLPSHLSICPENEDATLVVELAYSFLPAAWGKGYATEALTAFLQACVAPAASAFWSPWEKVWMRVIVNGRNPASLKVMRKLAGCRVSERGVYVWKGEKIFIGGEWRTEDDLFIFGRYLRE